MAETDQYSVFTRERERTLDTQLHIVKSLDQWTLTLSGGAFGLSLAFLRQIAPNPINIKVLICAWIMLGLSLASTLFGFMAGLAAYRKHLAITEEVVLHGMSERRTTWATVTRILNAYAIAFLLLGITSLATFAAMNVGGG